MQLRGPFLIPRDIAVRVSPTLVKVRCETDPVVIDVAAKMPSDRPARMKY
jgi:hypothetical protein